MVHTEIPISSCREASSFNASVVINQNSLSKICVSEFLMQPPSAQGHSLNFWRRWGKRRNYLPAVPIGKVGVALKWRVFDDFASEIGFYENQSILLMKIWSYRNQGRNIREIGGKFPLAGGRKIYKISLKIHKKTIFHN